METIVPIRIQIIAIITSLAFLIYIGRLILKEKLREEYSIVWIICTLLLLIFSIWRGGLDIISHFLGVYQAPNLIFAGAIFAIFSYLLHLSVVVSNLHEKNKILTQELAILKKIIEDIENNKGNKKGSIQSNNSPEDKKTIN
ncbi:MAG TPA: DUF2304 domain-containing protein [Bacteroidales bacterium]|nr:DUF2304 domain-containing protein [Bacteroidales bacterium]